MKLFKDTELFITGTRGRQSFDIPNGDLLLIDNFFDKEESNYYYNTFHTTIPWTEYEVTLYDKNFIAPRMISWFRESEKKEGKFSKWPTELINIREKIEKEFNLQFNAVLLNFYRNGKDGVGWHSDKTESSNKNMNIVSVTFGETRIFKLRHKFLKNTPLLEIPLHHGTLLFMCGSTNTYWEHQVPKTSQNVLPRINLTFRQLSEKL